MTIKQNRAAIEARYSQTLNQRLNDGNITPEQLIDMIVNHTPIPHQYDVLHERGQARGLKDPRRRHGQKTKRR